MGFKPDLDDQLVSISLVIWPVKIVPEMTYDMSSVTLSLYTTTFYAHTENLRRHLKTMKCVLCVLCSNYLVTRLL